jgi:hypothetical protein
MSIYNQLGPSSYHDGAEMHTAVFLNAFPGQFFTYRVRPKPFRLFVRSSIVPVISFL